MGYYLKEKNRMKKRGGNKIHKVKKKKKVTGTENLMCEHFVPFGEHTITIHHIRLLCYCGYCC